DPERTWDGQESTESDLVHLRSSGRTEEATCRRSAFSEASSASCMFRVGRPGAIIQAAAWGGYGAFSRFVFAQAFVERLFPDGLFPVRFQPAELGAAG